MRVIIHKDSNDVGKACALLFAAEVMRNPGSVLGFATGSTPLDAYGHMIALHKEGFWDMSGVTTFNLDEYYSLDKEHPQSYARFMRDNLFSHINLDDARVNFLSGLAKDAKAECEGYERRIADAGGIGLQLLGIGRNGHIAFNEPGDCFPDKTHLVELMQSTIDANKRFFNSADEVPKSALSMGIGSIMRCKRIVLVATGEEKAKAVSDTVKGAVTPMVPASILQMHGDCVFLLDKAAAALL